MPFIEANDISFVLSGGSANSDANESLGGLPSSVPLVGVENNLFANIAPEEASSGLIDHRCFYIFNDSTENPLLSSDVFFQSEALGGASVEMGVSTSTDLQKISVTGGATGGDADMLYEGLPFNWAFDANFVVWAQNLQDGLNGLADLSGTVVQVSQTVSTLDFFISFEGQDDNRNHQLVQVYSNNYLPGGTNITITKITEGAPINSVAPQIAVDTATPTNVDFSNPTELTPISLGRLGPGDGVPIWIRRTTNAGSLSFPNDGFKFRLKGEPF